MCRRKSLGGWSDEREQGASRAGPLGFLPPRWRDERGSGTLQAAGIIAAACLVLVALLGYISLAQKRSQIQFAADFAALAAAEELFLGGDFCALANQAAAKNGARVVSCEEAPSSSEDLNPEQGQAGGASSFSPIPVDAKIELELIAMPLVKARARAGPSPLGCPIRTHQG